MAASNVLQRCPRGPLASDIVDVEDSMSGDTVPNSSFESPVNGDELSHSPTPKSIQPGEISSPGSGPSANRPRTKRGRNGKKWIGLNWEHKEQLKQENDGKLPQIEALTTSSFPCRDEWSEDNLPEILFYIKPPKSKYEGEPVSVLKENGEVVKVGVQEKPLRDFPILPRRISLDVPGWLVETWRRIDPRITYPDILDRQIEDPARGLKKLDKNALQNHCRRECRMVLGMWTNYERRDVPHRTDIEAIECLSYQNIMLNTILNVCPGRQDRLIKVRLTKRSKDDCGKYYSEPCEVNESNLNKTTFAIDHFLLKSEIPPDGLHSMSDSMLAAWELSLILQERARLHEVSHWRKLADSCRPVSWFDRTANKRAANDSFDGGCSVCTWVPGRDQERHKEWVDKIKYVSHKSNNRETIKKEISTHISKRRKLKNKTTQDVSINAVDECECCKETEYSIDQKAEQKDESKVRHSTKEYDVFEKWQSVFKKPTLAESSWADCDPHEDLEALWWADSEHPKKIAIEEPTDNAEENITSISSPHLRVKGQLALGWDQYTPLSELNGLWTQPSLALTADCGLDQKWVSSNSGYPRPLLSGEVTPSLITSFPTQSEASDGETRGLDMFVGNADSDLAKVGKSVNHIGLFAPHDVTTDPLSRRRGKRPMREVGSAFLGDTITNSGSFEEYMSPSDDLHPNFVSGSSMYDGYDPLNNYTTGNIYDGEGYLNDDSVSPTDGPMLDSY